MMWGSFVTWRISGGAAPFLCKGQQSVLVEPRCGHQDVEEYCRRRDVSTASFMPWARHLLTREDLRKRKERLRNLRLETLERQGKKARSKRSRRSPRYRYSVRTDQQTDCSSGVLGHACRSDELERHEARRVCRGAWSFAACAAHLARSPRRIRRRNGLALAASSGCSGSIKQRC